MEKQSFETDRIQELKNERISLQQKTFTKWINTFLQENMKVDNIFEDLSDGKVLIRLLESISGEKVGRVARGKQRIHKLENVSKALMFLQKSVKLESIGPEDIVDGKQDLILGLLWMIILRFQISKVENESGSQDARSAKEALLLWCQRKTKGYPGVEIKNFTTSWRNGLAFNALIHKHRPDLLDFSALQPQQHTVNLGLAFDTAEQRLGIAKLLDPEDLDIPRPDEKSVMTYVSMLYQYFAKMKHEETGGKRIAKILDVMIEIDKMKQKYTDMVEILLEWIANKKGDLDSSVPKTSNLLQKSMNELKTLRTSDKPPKYIERANIEELFFVIQTKINANRLKPYLPPAGKTLSDINAAWQELEKAEHRREIRLREELARQERLSQLAERFEKKAKLRDSWLDDMLHVLEAEETSKSLQITDVNVSLKRLEAIETDVKAREIKINSVTAISKELHAEMYESYDKVRLRQEVIETKWQKLLTGLKRRRNLLVGLNEVTPLLADIEQVGSQLKEFEVNLSIEDQKKELIAIDDQIHKHSLLESQLNSYQRQIKSFVVSANELLRKKHPHSTLVKEKLQEMTRSFEKIAKASNEKLKRLEDSRDFHSFKDTMKKELAFIQEKAQLAGSKEVGKDLVSLTRLQTKLQGLEAEVDACQARCDAVCQTGNQLIDVKNASSEVIKSMITDLQNSLQNLRLLMKDRAERLAEASQSFQYYSDANDVESWIGEQMQLVMSEYYGKDSETAKSLLQRHEQITEEIIAFNEDMLMLQDECKQIEATDNKTDANQKESSPRQTRKEYDEVEVETETEDEEIIEREVDKRVIKEFKVPQVIARHSYEGEGLCMKKGEIFYLAAKTNKDWWSVRRVSSKESGYIPAAYVKEIEPKIFKKPVIEKVKVQEKVKIKRKKMKKVKIERKDKEGLVDKRAKRTSSILRKTSECVFKFRLEP